MSLGHLLHPARRSLLAGVAFALALVALPAVPASADRSAQLLMEDNHVLYGAGAPEAVAQWKALGADGVRLIVRWNRIAPDAAATRKPSGFQAADPNDPRYDWSELDRAMGILADNGLRPWLAIPTAGPLWASAQPRRHDPTFKPKPAEFSAFAQAVARRYGRRVTRMMLGSEPNQRIFLSPQLTCRRRHCTAVAPALYRNMVRAAYPAVKRVAPWATVLVGELAPIGSSVRNEKASLKPMTFLRELACVNRKLRPIRTGACRHFKPIKGDGFGFHPYQVKQPPSRPQRDPDLVKLGDLPRLMSTLDTLTAHHRILSRTRRMNLYLTEFAYETNPPDRAHGVSPATQQRYLAQSDYIAWRTRRVKTISQYIWQDEPLQNNGAGSRRFGGFQSGLLFESGRPKPALASFPNPFYIDAARRTFWGQVRPGGATTVTLRMQARPGAAFRPIARIRTTSLGYWHRKLKPRKRARYDFTYRVTSPDAPGRACDSNDPLLRCSVMLRG